jgi:signal transduction histidine kinase
MTPVAVPVVRRRGWRPRVRARLAVLYAALFLLAGAGLLALTYALVTNVLLPSPVGTSKPISPRIMELLGQCKQDQGPGQVRVPASLVQNCNHALAAAGFASASQRASELDALRMASLIGLAVLTIASVGLGWLVSGRTLRPVRSITEAARRASELRLGDRLALTGPDDEFKQLADTFDVMLERLDAAFTSQKRFVANAAHELRTPLTAMRTAIEVTLSKPTKTPEELEAMAASITRSVERAEATVEALLTLATSEMGPVATEPIDLATAAEDALDATQAMIDQRHITVDSALQPALAYGDRVLLERMIANLVQNAVCHNNADGWIGIRTTQRPDSALFEIANTGPSVSAEHIPRLFEPFARAEQRVNGSAGVGLGLSIANAIADVHNATITTRPRSGGGLEMSVTIPNGPR